MSPHLKERIQAQIQSALRALPQWVFALLHSRLEKLDLSLHHSLVEPGPEASFWRRWSIAVEESHPLQSATTVDERWAEASSRDLLVEVFAAYALNPGQPRWQGWPTARQFLAAWRATVSIPGEPS